MMRKKSNHIADSVISACHPERKLLSFSVYSFLFVTLSLSLISCRKDLPLPTDGEVLFSVTGQLEGKKWQLEAGIDDYYLDTDHGIDDEAVREFSGHFRPTDCKDCRESLKLVIRDYKRDISTEAVNLDSVFKDQFYLYRGEVPVPDGRTFRFRGHSGGTPPYEYMWDFGDGNTSSEAEPKHQFTGDSAYQVSVYIKDANGCSDQSRNEVVTGERFNQCDIEFIATPQGSSQIHLDIDYPNIEQDFPFVLWSFGDGTVAQGTYSPTHTYDFPGIYEVKMVLFSPDGQICCDIKNIYSEPSETCASYIAYRSANPTPALRRIYLIYTDDQGKRYTTDYFEGQPDDSYFELLDWETYKDDPDGQPTVKLEVKFQCRLFEIDNEDNYIDLNDASARFAVAYPDD
ncbi:MAG: PKD domain-containing protein [Bacteroidia bacterium]